MERGKMAARGIGYDISFGISMFHRADALWYDSAYLPPCIYVCMYVCMYVCVSRSSSTLHPISCLSIYPVV